MEKEEHVIVLDFLAEGYPGRRHPEPIAQGVGTHFTLLELVAREDISLEPGQEVYIGEGKREKIKYIKGTLKLKELTNFANDNLEDAINKIIEKREDEFVKFFNKGGMITPRMHQFQLLPGIGRKHVSDMLDARKQKDFESLDDIKKRVKLFPDPKKVLTKRIKKELEGNEKYYLFVPKKSKRNH